MLRTLLLLLAPAAAVASRNSQQTTIKLGLEWFLNPDHLPLVVALREGYFSDAGLDVQLIAPADHWEAEEEILAGRLDVAVTETLHLAQDAAKGKPVMGFSRFLHTDGGVMFLESANITRPKDMCGKTISYPGSPGPGGPAIVQTMVEADGGTCELSSYGKHNGGFYNTKALQEGAAGVATLIFHNFEVIEARGLGLRPGFFSLKDWGVPDFCQLVLFSTPQACLRKTPKEAPYSRLNSTRLSFQPYCLPASTAYQHILTTSRALLCTTADRGAPATAARPRARDAPRHRPHPQRTTARGPDLPRAPQGDCRAACPRHEPTCQAQGGRRDPQPDGGGAAVGGA